MVNRNLTIDWKFKKAVREKGLTLQVLQDLTGINQAFLSLYSKGRYNLDNLEKRKISMVLKMPESEIFS